jgi:hypothetical protein
MASTGERGISVWSLLLGFATALVVAATAYLCAWYRFRDSEHFNYEQAITRRSLDLLRAEIEDFRKTKGKLPATLPDLNAKQDVVDTRRFLDGWGRPFEFQVEGDNYRLFSYGRDGAPGGRGFDADLYSDQKGVSEPFTFWEFATDPQTMGLRVGCILAGVIAFPLCLLQSNPRTGERPRLAKVLAANAVTAVFCILAALVMASLHIQPGH